MNILRLLMLLVCIVCVDARADVVPAINPVATFHTPDGDDTGLSYLGSAPLTVTLSAGAADVGAYAAHYEWRFRKEGAHSPYLIRYDEDTEYTFVEAGTHIIELYATFVLGTDTIAYTADYWADATPITVSISESKLEMPNAFSPNGDGINDVYRAKSGCQSIVEFKATIFNRWGQKLYEWTDPAAWMGRQVQRKGCGTGRLLCAGEGQGSRRQTIQHQERCQSAARIYRKCRSGTEGL